MSVLKWEKSRKGVGTGCQQPPPLPGEPLVGGGYLKTEVRLLGNVVLGKTEVPCALWGQSNGVLPGG